MLERMTHWPGDAAGHPLLSQDHRPSIISHLQPNGRLPATHRLTLSIGLLLRNAASLDQLLRDLYNPTSERFRQYLTADEFAREFGPLESDYEAVVAFAEARGFEVIATHSNRTLVTVRASVADVERALNVKMQTYPHPLEQRSFYAPDAEPRIDQALPILRV